MQATATQSKAALTQVQLQGLRLAALGAILGLVIAVAGRHVLDGLLYGVTASDPMSLGIIAALVCVVAALAALPPGRRATGVNPLGALRSE